MVRLAEPRPVDHRRVPCAYLTPTAVQLTERLDEGVRPLRKRDQVLRSILGDPRVGEKSGKSVFGVLPTEQNLDGLFGNERRSRFEVEALRVLHEHLVILFRDATDGSVALEGATEYVSLRGDRESSN